MKINNLFEAYAIDIAKPIFPEDPWVTTKTNITDGMISLDITTGIDYYEGPWQQPDTGSFTLVSRNPNLDPKINPSIKFNKILDFYDLRGDGNDFGSHLFFRGYITDISVNYVPNDNPIITITGTDAIGVLQRTLITQTMYDDYVGYGDDEGITFQQFVESDEVIYALSNLFFAFYFVKGESNQGGSLGSTVASYRPAKFIPQVGENMWSVINQYAQTNLDFIYADVPDLPDNYPFSQIKVFPFPKYNPSYWYPQTDPAAQYPNYNFSSRPQDNAPYKSLILDNGFKRITNQLEFYNTYREYDPITEEVSQTSQEFGVYELTDSVNTWGPAKQSLGTFFPIQLANNTEMQRYATDIFEIVGFPSDEVFGIEFDNAVNSNISETKSFYKIGQFIRIYHKLNETQHIDRFYNIGGIRHNITESNWTMAFIFQPSDQEIVDTYQGQDATISMNSLSGDTNFNFTATITDYPIENIKEVIWCLNGISFENTPTGFDIENEWNQAYTGFNYKDGLPRTGLTQTWNFDDDGILKNRLGTGYWAVIAFITLNTGWVVAPSVVLTVGSPTPVADFTWQQNLTNNYGQVTFTDTSRNNETGEPDSYLWDFGDGTTSTEQNPVHVYIPEPGEYSYDVSLTVFARFGGGTNTKTTTITLTEPAMVANFTYTQNYQTFNFTNTSTNVGFELPDAYLWDFGDGSTSTNKNPTHAFFADANVTITYNVSLTIKNIWGTTETTTQTVTITALNSSGESEIRYIQLRQDNHSSSDFDYYPLMYFFKGRTDVTLETLTNRSRIRNLQQNNITWYEADNTVMEGDLVQNQYNLRRDPAITEPNAYGMRPKRTSTSLPSNFKITIDMFNPGPIYPATSTKFLDNIIMNFRNYYSASSYPVLDVYTTDYIGDTMDNPDLYTWTKIGQFQLPNGNVGDTTRTMTAIYDMPLDNI